MPPAVAQFVGTKILLPIAVNLLVNKVLPPKPTRFRSASSKIRNPQLTGRSSVAPWRVIFGAARVGGTIVFVHNTGADTHFVIVLAGHQVESIGQMYFDDQAVTIDGSGDGTGNWAGAVHVEKKLGDHASTFADLITEAAPKWTANHKLLGRAHVWVRLTNSLGKFTQMPNITFDVQGYNLVDDPRGPSTGYSANAALCIAAYITNGSFGMGDAVDDTDLIAAANICDEDVDLNPSGTEDRYTCNGTFDVDEAPEDILQKLLTSMGGKMVRYGGKWHLFAAAYRAPGLEIDENDARGPISCQPRLSRRELGNRVKGVYIPTTGVPTDYPPVTNATYKTEDGEEDLWLEYDLPFTNSSGMAQRLAKIELEKTRQQITVRYPASLQAYQLRTPDTVQVTNARFGWNQKVFEIEDMGIAQDLDAEGAPVIGCDLLLRETASGIYDWNSGEETTVDLSPDTDLPDPFFMAPPTGLTLLADSTTALDVQDGLVTPRIYVTWTEPTNPAHVFEYDLEYKPQAESEWERAPYPKAGDTQAYIAPVTSGVTYDVRIRARNRLGVASAWATDSVAVTTRQGVFSGKPDPTANRIRRQNMVFDGGFNNANAWQVTAPTETPSNANAHETPQPPDADVEFANQANAYDGDTATKADGDWQNPIVGSKEIAGIVITFPAGTKTGKVRLTVSCAHGSSARGIQGKLELWVSTDNGSTWDKFGETQNTGQTIIDSASLGSVDMSQLKVKALGHPPGTKGGGSTGTGYIHSTEFVELGGAPYALVAASRLTLLGDGAAYAEARRPFPGVSPQPGVAIQAGTDNVVVIAARRVTAGAGPTHDLEVLLHDAEADTETALMTITNTDILDAWQYFALFFTPGSDISGELDIIVRSKSTNAIYCDKLQVSPGPTIPEFDTSVHERVNDDYGADDTPPPTTYTPAGDWDVPTPTYKIAGV